MGVGDGVLVRRSQLKPKMLPFWPWFETIALCVGLKQECFSSFSV